MNNQILLTPDFSNNLPVNNKSARQDTPKNASSPESSNQERHPFKEDMKRVEKESSERVAKRSVKVEEKSTDTHQTSQHTDIKQPPENTIVKEQESDLIVRLPSSTEVAVVEADGISSASPLDKLHEQRIIEMGTIEVSMIASTEADPVTLSNIPLNHSGVIIIGEGEGAVLPDNKGLPLGNSIQSMIPDPLKLSEQHVVNVDGMTKTSMKVSEMHGAGMTHIPSAVKMVEKLALEKVSVPADSWNSTNAVATAALNTSQLQDSTTANVTVAPTMPQSSTTTTTTTTPVTQLAISTPVPQPQWGEAVAEKVMWMSAKGIKEADIQLDPPELGPLTVKVSMSQEQAYVSFTVQHSSVREALDQSAMRLREMFAEEGINLADVDVSEHSQSGSDDKDNEGHQHTTETDSQEYAEVTETPVSSDNQSYSLIDSYV